MTCQSLSQSLAVKTVPARDNGHKMPAPDIAGLHKVLVARQNPAMAGHARLPQGSGPGAAIAHRAFRIISGGIRNSVCRHFFWRLARSRCRVSTRCFPFPSLGLLLSGNSSFTDLGRVNNLLEHYI